MMKRLTKFVIIFENANVVFFPGQFLSGRVIVELNDDTSVSGLYFHVVGEGVVNVQGQKHDKSYEKENYIDFRMRLLGEPGQRPVSLSSGIHSFPFKLGLPSGLPSTFLSKHGWIQYYCKTALREMNGIIHKNQQVFVVMNPIDLDSEPSILAQPFRCNMEHKFRISCINSGALFCRVVLDRGAYVPGETIYVSALIHNQSKIHIKNTAAVLKETIQFMVRNKIAHSETRRLAIVRKGKILSGEIGEWTNEQLHIPPLPPANLRGCHIISIQYDVYFIITPKGLEKEVKIQLPIVIATYPFREESDLDEIRKNEYSYPTTLPMFR